MRPDPSTSPPMPASARHRPLAEDLIARHFGRVGAVLTLGDVPVDRLVADHGSPLFAYDAALMRASYRALTHALGGFAEVYYSVKANPNPHLAAVFVAEGAGLEIASAGEYEAARAAGCAPDRIIYAGPTKTDAELDHVVARGIEEIHVETLGEVERLSRIACRHGVTVPVGIRVNPVDAIQGGAMRMGGKPSPFGFDEEGLDSVVDIVKSMPGLKLSGLHMFAGTQLLDATVLSRQWAHGLAVCRRVAGWLGAPLSTLDLGGGLGIPLFAGDGSLDLRVLAESAAVLAGEVRADPLLAATRILIEPGRHLVGPSGLYLARVIEVKVSRGERFVMTDGGMHHHLAASGNLGQVIKRDFPIVAATRLGAATTPATLVGPLCTPLDTLGRQTPLPDVEACDVIAVLQSGAYGLTASPTGFLSHPSPAELLVDDGAARLIRRRGTFADTVGRVV